MIITYNVAMKLELIATATFGLEAVVKRELQNLGFGILKSEDGKITYEADEKGIARSNLWLRTADRVLIKMGEFKALTFEDLFQGVKSIPWERFIEEDGNFRTDCTSVKSKLSSVPSCQSVTEKAIVERLKESYGEQRFSKVGAEFAVKISILKDMVTLSLDTTGSGLHKRSYRTKFVEAPIKETLASALVQLTFWRKDRLLVDPFCGSGTIAIEAAMIGRNIAPGLNRNFVSEKWAIMDKSIWAQERQSAYQSIDHKEQLKILASDIDKKAVAAARENALNAGVDDCIQFNVKPFSQLTTEEKRGIMITNIPYGERIGEEHQLKSIYKDINRFFHMNPSWSLFLITSDKSFEKRAMGRPANKRRKLYNGRIETTYYQYHGV
jgi:putative N6-adenine-specific DNA methylase